MTDTARSATRDLDTRKVAGEVPELVRVQKELAEYIVAEATAVERHVSAALPHAINCGRALIKLKEEVGHGAFIPIIEANFNFTRQTASTYMRLARAAEGGQIEMEGVLSISGALKQIGNENGEPEPEPDRPDQDPPPSPARWFTGKEDRWDDFAEPLTRFAAAARRRGFDFSHLNWKEAKKRVDQIDRYIADLEAMRADLEPRSHKAKLTFDR